MVPIALGSQTAGSTIRPASYCGVYGYKPSSGVFPRTGVLKTLDTLDHVTLFTRSVPDLELGFDVLRVKGANHPYVSNSIDRNGGKRKGPWKIALVRTPVWQDAEPYAQTALLKFAESIARLPHIRLEETELPDVFTEAHAVHKLIYEKALSYYFHDEFEKHREQLSDVFAEMVERGRKISQLQYQGGLEKQQQLFKALDGFLANYDGVVTLS